MEFGNQSETVEWVGDGLLANAAPYALGFATSQAHPDLITLRIEGTVPDWLKGALVRTAPARFEVGETPLTHWFDGHAMLHRFDIGGGRIHYRSRYLESEATRDAVEHGNLVRGEFGTDPARTLIGRVAAAAHAGPLTDNCNVNVVMRAGEMLALTETPLRLAFDPETLHVARHVDDAEHGSQIATAHPLYDAGRQTSYSYLLQLARHSLCSVVATDELTGEAQVVATFAIDHPPYLHSFGMSENYVVIALPPFVVDPLAMLLTGKPFIRNYRWRPELGLRFVIIDKRDGKVVMQAQADAAFFFHHVNAFEDEQTLVVDLIAYPDADIVTQLDLDRLRAAEPSPVAGELRRYRIDLATGDSTKVVLSQTPVEFPRIGNVAAGKPYRFVFGAGSRLGDMSDCIVKIDVVTGEAQFWSHIGLHPGEPVFVPDPRSRGEDDGVLLTVAFDVAEHCSWLVILDAATLAEFARAQTPYPVTFGFHGGFFPPLNALPETEKAQS
jgi:beta,beta-carotene 9',10'-dioxygenase